MTHEIQHLPWSPFNPHRCATCQGVGIVVEQVPSKRYKCGFITHAVTCTDCLGSGRNMPTAPDHKLAAAGDRL